MEYTPQNLEFAVSVFYNGEQFDRAKAHTWLTAAQRVPEAWKFVWELLQPSKGTEIQFYAATTLHTKILRCWNEVPPENYEELKEKLLQAVFTYSKGPKIVTNRLCISLAAFILQQGTVDLATILRPLSTMENTSLLLEVLTVIPEEYNSMTMGSALRAKNCAALQQACPAVLDDMLRYLQTVYIEYSDEGPPEASVQGWLRAANCAYSWLTLSDEDAAGALPDRLPLCRALLHLVRLLYSCSEAVSDSALEACEMALSAVRAAGAAPDAARQPRAALQLLADLLALVAPVLARDNVPNSINEELLSALITCCVALGECHTQVIVQAAEGAGGNAGEETARQLVEVLLAAQAAPGHYPLHETRSNLVFGFWYTLQDQVLNVPSEKELHPMWREVFSQLLTTLVCKSEVPADVTLSRDDIELLRCYRQDISDTVMYCFGILGEWCWTTVEAAYSAASTDARREAALHVFVALADAAPPQRAPDALAALLQRAVGVAGAPSPSSALLATALDCLGAYASWVGSVGEARGAALGGECVRAAGAALARSPAAAALALRRLCTDCRAPAAALAAHVVHAAHAAQSKTYGSKNEGGEVGNCISDAWVRRQLLGAAGAALAAADYADAAPLLQTLAATLYEDLQQQARSAARPGGGSGGGAAELAGALLAALDPQPALAADLLRALAPALPPFALHPALVEPMFHILKQAVATLMTDCIRMVGEIAQLTITGFNTRPCASGLDVVKLLVLFVGSEWPESPQLLHGCIARSAAAVASDPSACPDLTEALFALLHTITKKKPQYIDWIDDLLPELVDLGCECVRLWEVSAARAACGWLAALAAQRPPALQPRAPALTAAVLRCIGGATPRNQIEPLAELLLALNRAEWRCPPGAAAEQAAGLAGWLRQALAVAGFPTEHATDPHKHKFIAAVVKEKSSKRRLLETVQEFSLVCRGLIGTEYARQTLASRQLVA
ncbi:importin-13 [Galleria mellonella]|uniref:Importin-13 n=1 Tax=Galleria mellonella TaxID=7137 RepID=A0ABM3MMJ8_GALME|nr:importin-13 [Galleria mellonella]